MKTNRIYTFVEATGVRGRAVSLIPQRPAQSVRPVARSIRATFEDPCAPGQDFGYFALDAFGSLLRGASLWND